MREIEFRAWDKGNKCMFNHQELLKMTKELVPCYSGIPVNMIPSILIPINHQKYTIMMEYTGLKDKNGVKIYENDILKYIDFRNEESIIQVWWDEEDSCFNFGNRNLSMIKNKLEVIGNMCDNPELLEEE